MRSKLFVLVLAVSAAAGFLPSARAQTPYPVIWEPVLRPDTAWVRETWGFRHKDLVLDALPRATVFTMEGYDGASRPMPNAYLRMDDGELIALRIRYGQGPRGDYAMVQASIRGTECSAGNYNLYDRRHAWDGHHIIEWAAAQPWSNGRVGMFGSSYPGQTTYWTAATQPPHLYAVSANLLHSDIYRDIFMPGAVQNYLFPSLWTYAVGPHRLPQTATEEGSVPNDEICTQNQASRYLAGDLPQPQNEPAWAALRATDDDWYVDHAALTFAPAIRIPYYQQTNWQDEQVGPRAVVLFNHIHPDPKMITDTSGRTKTVTPKLFVTSNGDHGFGGYAGRHRWDWFDIWLLDMPDTKGLLDQQVLNYFEARDDGTWTARKTGDAWPFADSRWERLYLHGGQGISDILPSVPEAPDNYVSGIATRNYGKYESNELVPPNTMARNLPDAVVYESEPFAADFAVAGPILFDLYASMAGTDTDFFVSLHEVFPDGSTSYLQRGMLKASHNAVDPQRSYRNANGEIVQPYRPHTNPQPIMPGEIVHYPIEIFPLGHIFHEGNRLRIQIHTPPTIDGIWGYTPTHHQPAIVSVYHDPDHPTSLYWPVVTPDAVEGTADPNQDCKVPGGFPCVPPSPL